MEYDPARIEADNRYRKLQKQAEEELIRIAFRRHFREKIASGEVTALPPALQRAVQDLGPEVFAPPKKPVQSYFITIGAKEGVDPKEFWGKMAQVIKKKALQGTGEYSLEQRSEAEQDPYGWHIHWILTPKEYVTKSVVVQQVYQCFTKYVAAQNYVDVQPIRPTEEDMARVKAYIQGQKCLEKLDKVARDKTLRQTLGIPEITSY